MSPVLGKIDPSLESHCAQSFVVLGFLGGLWPWHEHCSSSESAAAGGGHTPILFIAGPLEETSERHTSKDTLDANGGIQQGNWDNIHSINKYLLCIHYVPDSGDRVNETSFQCRDFQSS